MKYLAKSADVLNEADRFERILNWQLFCIDQERMLYSDPETWVPADGCYPNPLELCETHYCSGCRECAPIELHSMYGGNYVRPMVEEIELDREYTFNPRCERCDVSWSGPTDCWVCGKTPKNFSYYTGLGNEAYTEGEETGLRGPLVQIIWSDEAQQMQAIWSESFNQFRASIRESFAVLERRMFSFAVALDEWVVANPDIRRINASTPRRGGHDVFARAHFELNLDGEFGVASDLDRRVRGRVVLPADVDLSGRIEPEFPHIEVDPVDFENLRSTWPVSIPVTERRRAR